MVQARLEHGNIEQAAEALELKTSSLQSLFDTSDRSHQNSIYLFNELDIIYIPRIDGVGKCTVHNNLLAKALNRYLWISRHKRGQVLFIVIEGYTPTELGEDESTVTADDLLDWYDAYLKYLTDNMPIPITKDIMFDLYETIIKANPRARLWNSW